MIKDNLTQFAHFYLEIMETEENVSFVKNPVELSPESIRKWQAGEAALQVVSPDLNLKKLWDRFLKITGICQKWQRESLINGMFLRSLRELNPVQQVELLADYLNLAPGRTRWGDILQAPVELLDFIFLHTFKPMLHNYKEKLLGQLSLEEWDRGFCPICGAKPSMAKLTGREGSRQLFCARCETQWGFRRLGCPYCNEGNSTSASFLAFDDQNRYRVYLCEVCKTYLKTVDERKGRPVADLFCEDLGTLILDQIAQKEGYRRGDNRQLA
ncbi:MAG TPA: formate dehydrogenase accessory protein FdhE [Clostridia bacterium]|nr:formate dehydrogenase accessory protein FdhE [Clostridia bacterium]